MREIRSPHSKTRNFDCYERCPAYWGKQGYQIDPSDRTKLLLKTETEKRGRFQHD